MLIKLFILPDTARFCARVLITPYIALDTIKDGYETDHFSLELFRLFFGIGLRRRILTD